MTAPISTSQSRVSTPASRTSSPIRRGPPGPVLVRHTYGLAVAAPLVQRLQRGRAAGTRVVRAAGIHCRPRRPAGGSCRWCRTPARAGSAPAAAAQPTGTPPCGDLLPGRRPSRAGVCRSSRYRSHRSTSSVTEATRAHDHCCAHWRRGSARPIGHQPRRKGLVDPARLGEHDPGGRSVGRGSWIILKHMLTIALSRPDVPESASTTIRIGAGRLRIGWLAVSGRAGGPLRVPADLEICSTRSKSVMTCPPERGSDPGGPSEPAAPGRRR